MIDIPTAQLQAREAFVHSFTVLKADQALKIVSGKRHTVLQTVDLEYYSGERGRRGKKLPRGFQKIDGIEAV